MSEEVNEEMRGMTREEIVNHLCGSVNCILRDMADIKKQLDKHHERIEELSEKMRKKND